jgi:hypothetical protein
MPPKDRVIVREIEGSSLYGQGESIAPSVLFTSGSAPLEKGFGELTHNTYRTIGGYALYGDPFYTHVKNRSGPVGSLVTRAALSLKTQVFKAAVYIRS